MMGDAVKLKRKGQFFRVDPLQWQQACRLSNRAMVAYLVLARGTGANNTTTQWSVNAIGKYGAMRSEAARRAVSELIEANLVSRVSGNGERPSYECVPATPVKPDQDERYIWLPNTFVDGARNEVPPVRKCIQAGEHDVLRIIVSLYGVHELRDNHGLDAALIRRDHRLYPLGTIGRYQVWHYDLEEFCPRFNEQHSYVGILPEALSGADEIFRALEWAEWSGLGRWELALFAGDPDDAELLHPLTDELAEAANTSVDRLDRFHDEPRIPIDRHIKPCCADVFRFRYRPATKATGEWSRDRAEKFVQWRERYDAIFSECTSGQFKTGGGRT